MLGSSQEGCSFGCRCWNRACMLHKSLQTSKPPTLTQRQYNQGEATQGHPGEGPRDGQHAVGDGGGAQHPKYDREHKWQHEHGFPTKPAASTVVGYLQDGNLVQEKGLKWWNERLKEVSENITCSAKTTWCLRVGETALDIDSAAVMWYPTHSQPALWAPGTCLANGKSSNYQKYMHIHILGSPFNSTMKRRDARLKIHVVGTAHTFQQLSPLLLLPSPPLNQMLSLLPRRRRRRALWKFKKLKK